MTNVQPVIKPYVNKLSKRSQLLRLLWSCVWMLLFRPTPSWAFFGWRNFLLRLFGAKIGKGSKIRPTCRVWAPWNLEIGRLVALADNVDCYAVAPIRIGDKVAISQGAYLCTASHDISSPGMELIYRPIAIGTRAWVAARAFVGPGVTIGEGAVVGACAVVTKDVKSWTVVAGNPARYIRDRAWAVGSGKENEPPH